MPNNAFQHVLGSSFLGLGSWVLGLGSSFCRHLNAEVNFVDIISSVMMHKRMKYDHHGLKEAYGASDRKKQNSCTILKEIAKTGQSKKQ